MKHFTRCWILALVGICLAPFTARTQIAPPPPIPLVALIDGVSHAAVAGRSPWCYNPGPGEGGGGLPPLSPQPGTIGITNYLPFTPSNLRDADCQAYLWPAGQHGQTFVNALVYNAYVPGHRLSRFGDGVPIKIWASPGLDTQKHTELDQMASDLADATGWPVTYAGPSATYPSAQGTIYVIVQKTNYSGLTVNSFAGNTIVRSKITVSYMSQVTGGMLRHEGGHALGLGHDCHFYSPPLPVEQMCPGGDAFYQEELDVIHMMYQHREPHNVAPDNGTVPLSGTVVVGPGGTTPPITSEATIGDGPL